MMLPAALLRSLAVPRMALAISTALLMSVRTVTAGWPAPVRLRIEGLEQQAEEQLLVLSETLPRFSFSHGLGPLSVPPPPRGLTQAAYRITVVRRTDIPDMAPPALEEWQTLPSSSSSSSGGGGGGVVGGRRVAWDSGVVHTANSSDILYAGDPLHAFGAYTWTAAWLATGKCNRELRRSVMCGWCMCAVLT
jgi:hypothetical protein